MLSIFYNAYNQVFNEDSLAYYGPKTHIESLFHHHITFRNIHSLIGPSATNIQLVGLNPRFAEATRSIHHMTPFPDPTNTVCIALTHAHWLISITRVRAKGVIIMRLKQLHSNLKQYVNLLDINCKRR